jgi:hypothetical protein
MMAKEDVSTRKVSLEQKKLPKGARVLSKEISTRVEEIENGYLVIKNIEYRYETGTGKDTRTDWLSINKRWYTKEDPLEIVINTKDKALADSFNAE